MTTTTFDDNLVTEEDAPAEKKPSQLFSVGGIMMLFIAGIFDLLGYISIVLYLALGIGLIIGRIASVCGFIVIGGWQLLRSGKLPSKKSSNTSSAAVEKLGKKFFKKHWKKLAAEAAPVIGDFWPTFILIVYSELNE